MGRRTVLVFPVPWIPVPWNQSCPSRQAQPAVAEHSLPLGDKLSVEQGFLELKPA